MPSEPPGYDPYPPAPPRERAGAQRNLTSPAEQRQRQRQRQEDMEEGEAGESSGEEGVLADAAIPASAQTAGPQRRHEAGAERQPSERRQSGSKRDWGYRDDPQVIWRQQQEAWVAAGSRGHPPPPPPSYAPGYHTHLPAHPRAPSSGGSPLVTAEALQSPTREPTPGSYPPHARPGASDAPHPPGETYHTEAVQEQYEQYYEYHLGAAAAKGPDMLGR